MYRLVLLCLLLGMLSCKQDTSSSIPTSERPEAKQVIHTFEEHGTTREDPYHWLSDKEDPEVIEFLKAENAYTESSLAHTAQLQEELYDELVARIEQRYESLPTKENGYWYYSRYEEGNEYPYYCRRKGNMAAEEEIILNVDEMAKPHEVYLLFQYFVSPDNQKVAFLVDTSGDRRNTLFFKDLSTGALLPDQVSNCSYGGGWSADNQHFFYTLNDKTVRGYRVMRHKLSDATDQDQQIYIEPDSTFSVSVSTSWDDRFLMVSSNSTTSTEAWFLPADQPTTDLKVIQPRQKDLEYSVESFPGDVFYIYNNHNAQNFKISKAHFKI